MIVFWLITLLLVAAALAAILPTLRGGSGSARPGSDQLELGVYRDRLEELKSQRDEGALSQADFEEAKAELEAEVARELPESSAPPGDQFPRRTRSPRWAPPLVIVAVPALVVAIYLGVGRPELVAQAPATRMAPAQVQEFLRMPVSRRVSALQDYLESHPRAGEAWFLLARSHRQQERYDQAVKAFRRARELMGSPAELLAEYAEAVALAREGGISPRATRLANRALEKDPDHQLALWVAGSGAMAAGDRERAARLWRRLARQLPPDSGGARLLRGYIARAEDTTPGAVTIEREEKGAGTSGLAVRVVLADKLRDRARPGDTVFIFARPADGGGPPLAAVRRRVSDLPTRVTLSDAEAMRPGRKISQADRVVVGARISRSGQVMAESGDLQGLTDPISVKGTQKVEVTIDRVIP